jgi:hypothetical protein
VKTLALSTDRRMRGPDNPRANHPTGENLGGTWTLGKTSDTLRPVDYDPRREIRYATHALQRMQERQIPRSAVDSTVLQPDRVEPVRYEGALQFRLYKRFPPGLELKVVIDPLRIDGVNFVVTAAWR